MAQYPELYTMEYLKRRTEKNGDCWTWTGKTCNGYATVAYRDGNKPVYKRVHRMTYELVRGEIPSGLVIDHLCDNPKCINPEHLEPKTIFDNAARGNHQSAINKKKTHCIRGHEFDSLNTYINPKNRTRHCKKCKAAYYKKGANYASTRVHS